MDDDDVAQTSDGVKSRLEKDKNKKKRWMRPVPALTITSSQFNAMPAAEQQDGRVAESLDNSLSMGTLIAGKTSSGRERDKW